MIQRRDIAENITGFHTRLWHTLKKMSRGSRRLRAKIVVFLGYEVSGYTPEISLIGMGIN
jgi:hypothetical protein